MKKIYRKILRSFSGLFYLFYVPLVFASLQKKIDRLARRDFQLFFLARMDFGTYLFHLLYAACWEKQRGKVAFVILTPHIKEVKALAKHLIPEAPLIYPHPFLPTLAAKFFRPTELFWGAFVRVFGMLTAFYPQALYIYYPAYHSLYNPFLDKRLKKAPKDLSPEFVAAYKQVRKYWNLREEALYDLFHLHLQRDSSQEKYAASHLATLKNALSIKECFVVLNLNAKNYHRLNNKENHRRLYHPERYNCMIDVLIEKGFQVVLQGRKEQPQFKARKGLIDYAHSVYCSPENDLGLYAGAYFAIVNKTGPETFSSITNTPLLGLNYTEISCLIPHLKSRFFPKYAFNAREGRRVSWKEYLALPSFFDLNKHIFSPDIEYLDIGVEEMLEALEEFLSLMASQEWLTLTPSQRAFKEQLHPLHLDLYEMKTSIPCDTYLRRNEVELC